MKIIEKLPGWLRWILCPISSVLALLIVLSITQVFFKFNLLGISNEAWFDKVWLNLIAPAATGFSAIYVGVLFAPSYKRIVSLVLGSFFVMFGGIGLLGTLADGNWWGLINIVFTVFGVGAGIYTVFEEVDEQKHHIHL